MNGFYDTCVFQLAFNPADRDHAHCSALVDVGAIEWSVSFSEISRAESTFNEYLDNFITQCVQNGVDCVEVKISQIQSTQKKFRETKKALENEDMHSRDIKQVFAARFVNAEILVTRDRDFNNPSSKSTKQKVATKGDVSKILRKELDILVMGPKEGLNALKKSPK